MLGCGNFGADFVVWIVLCGSGLWIFGAMYQGASADRPPQPTLEARGGLCNRNDPLYIHSYRQRSNAYVIAIQPTVACLSNRV